MTNSLFKLCKGFWEILPLACRQVMMLHGGQSGIWHHLGRSRFKSQMRYCKYTL
uniref:Uncharacterized protein n=1 Tax=Anguilla anguilla TaxID=7936 RepID=A0A0E9SV84_ANGAN